MAGSLFRLASTLVEDIDGIVNVDDELYDVVVAYDGGVCINLGVCVDSGVVASVSVIILGPVTDTLAVVFVAGLLTGCLGWLVTMGVGVGHADGGYECSRGERGKSDYKLFRKSLGQGCGCSY